MRSTIAKIVFGMVFAVLSLNGQMVSQRIDPLDQMVTAGPHLPALPVTMN